MKRLIDWHLKSWMISNNRKPLILRGARQVGKTHAVRTLGTSFESFVEINFELLPEAKNIFTQNLVPKRIVWELELLTNQKIIPGKTLLFFDEVQTAPQAITAMRYFYELMPDLHLISAGSLLDFAIEKVGIPVGRVSTLYIYPLSFLEFLCATGHPQFIKAILNEELLSDANHFKLLDFLAQYLVIGGLPEVVSNWIETMNPSKCQEVQKQLIETYRQDFPKYAKTHQIKYVETLFNQIPHFIGHIFKYSAIHGEYKKRELAPSLDLLCHANVVHRVTHSAGNGIPIGAGINLEHFKLIFLDVGIEQAMLGVDLAAWFLNKERELVNRGTVAEAFVGQELLCYASPKWKQSLHFWKREAKGAMAEVDYLFEHGGSVIPIEVKSGHGSTLRSMHQFLSEHPKSKYGIRFSSQSFSTQDKLLSKPLYAVATLAHADQQEAIATLIENHH